MKRALLVGINAYPTAPLNGCVNDINDVASFIVSKCGFNMNDVRLLTDERATKKAIVERLGWLINGIRSGDHVLLYMSGHGCQMATRNPAGEVDNLDEVFCPVDFAWTDDTALRDKEFNQLFSSIPAGVSFTWVSDSCHSADLFKLISKNKTVPKSFPMPAEMQWKIQTAKKKGLKPLGFSKAAGNFNGLFLSGCKSDQTSEDAYIAATQRYNGALTYYLLETLKGTSGLTDPMQTIVTQVSSVLDTNGYSQKPQLEGNDAKKKLAFLQ